MNSRMVISRVQATDMITMLMRSRVDFSVVHGFGVESKNILLIVEASQTVIDAMLKRVPEPEPETSVPETAIIEAERKNLESV
jgi:hypothetical protein